MGLRPQWAACGIVFWAGVGLGAPVTMDAALDRNAFRAALWDDGLAEVATYDYRPSGWASEDPGLTLTAITSAEELNREMYTRATWPYGQTPIMAAMRWQAVLTEPDGPTARQGAVTVHIPRHDNRRAIKLVAAWLGWEGIQHREVQRWQLPGMLLHASWRDREGTGSRQLASAPDAHFEEELPLLLRGLAFKDGLEVRLQLFPSLWGGRGLEVEPSASLARVEAREGGWRVVVESVDGRRQVFDFAAEYPHLMERWEHSDGRTITLRSVRRYDWWQAQP